jgi:hypothetical protein
MVYPDPRLIDLKVLQISEDKLISQLGFGIGMATDPRNQP